MELHTKSGPKMFFSFAYMKMQVMRIFWFQRPLNIVETFEIKVDDEEAERLGLK